LFNDWIDNTSPLFLNAGYELGETLNSPTPGEEPKVMLDQRYYAQWSLISNHINIRWIRSLFSEKYSISQPYQRKRLVNQTELARAAECKTMRASETRHIVIQRKI